MSERSLRDDAELARSDVVANSTMNRARNLAGPNSYAKELGFDVAAFLRRGIEARGHASWLDLCCGEGRALLQAAELFAGEGLADRVTLVGVDLVPAFAPASAAGRVTLHTASLAEWRPEAGAEFDLITGVHGLHYIGDKLGLIARAVSWLTDDGRFLAHLDPRHLRLGDAGPSATVKALRAAGLAFDARRHLLSRDGRLILALPYTFLGADDGVGPNYTGQTGVLSCYAAV